MGASDELGLCPDFQLPKNARVFVAFLGSLRGFIAASPGLGPGGGDTVPVRWPHHRTALLARAPVSSRTTDAAAGRPKGSFGIRRLNVEYGSGLRPACARKNAPSSAFRAGLVSTR